MTRRRFLLVSLTVFFILVSGMSFALSDAEIDKMSARLDQLSEKLQDVNLAPGERAALLYEKSSIMLIHMSPGGLRTGTESLLKAIELEPSNKEYKFLLKETYNQLWKDRDLSGDDKISTDLRELRGRVIAAMEK